MQTDRSTFHESWYRVEALTPRLVSAVKVHPQHFRGVKWTVLQNPVNNQFFRLSEGAYHFVAMLDGKRTVREVWNVCMEKLGDAAPTQGEAIHLLGQLYNANLLSADVAPDAEAIFRRYRKRVQREMRGRLSNFLFIRVPLLDPDRFLDVWAKVFGWLFTWYGLVVWAIIVGAGLWAVAGQFGHLAGRASGVLSPENLPLLYLSIVLVKCFHEMGHAMACKHLGRKDGSGEVHEMGVSLLVFTPLPYVDASSAWALRNKWHRVVVGASGVLMELAIASVAAILWTQTAQGGTLNALAFNVMFIASVSTLLFNGNPFLRYDAYYVLSDVIEIPNLDFRSRAYVGYLVKRYAWGVRQLENPGHTTGEKAWLLFYAVTSVIVRAIVMWFIVLFIGGRFFVVGMVMATVIVVLWVARPLGKAIRYLAVDEALGRVRMRAVLTSLIVFFSALLGVGLVRAPDRCRIEGVVEPVKLAAIHVETEGFVKGFLPSNVVVVAEGSPLIEAKSPELETQMDQLQAELRYQEVRRQLAQTQEPAAGQIVDEEILALGEQIARTRERLKTLALKSPITGTWVAPDIEWTKDTYLSRGQKMGVVASLEDLRIRAVAGQKEAATLIKEASPLVEMKVKGRPDMALTGKVEAVLAAGSETLPSAALGYTAGGWTQIDPDDQSGCRAAEPFFEFLVRPCLKEGTIIRPGQTMVVRFERGAKPLLVQGWRALLQLFQNRFQV